MAVRWPKKISSGRIVRDFVSTTDLAPTFLEAAGVAAPKSMTGKSWIRLFENEVKPTTELIDPSRDFVVFGKERHVPGQEAPDVGGYPMRAIRTADFLLIKNYRPDRWPNGTPNYKKAQIPSAWLADTDNGPTKTYIVENREKDHKHQRSYDLCFAKRPELELYDIKNDPQQLTNIANDPEFAKPLAELHDRLRAELLSSNDPREKDSAAATEFFDAFKYLGSGPRHPSFKRKKRHNNSK